MRLMSDNVTRTIESHFVTSLFEERLGFSSRGGILHKCNAPSSPIITHPLYSRNSRTPQRILACNSFHIRWHGIVGGDIDNQR